MEIRMKNKLGFILCCIFILVIIVINIVGFAFAGFNIFSFFKNAALTLGNGNIFVGILLTVLSIFGLINSVIGLLNPPKWQNNILEDAPQWIAFIYAVLSYLGTPVLIILFIAIINK